MEEKILDMLAEVCEDDMVRETQVPGALHR